VSIWGPLKRRHGEGPQSKDTLKMEKLVVTSALFTIELLLALASAVARLSVAAIQLLGYRPRGFDEACWCSP